MGPGGSDEGAGAQPLRLDAALAPGGPVGTGSSEGVALARCLEWGRGPMLSSPHIPTPSEELMRRYDVAGPRYTSYPTVPEWKQDFGTERYAERLDVAASAGADEPLSLYVHLPFCR